MARPGIDCQRPALGIPLGVILGRAFWNLFADRLGVSDDALTPAVAIALAVPATLLVAAIVATIPARLARRTSAAEVLRSAVSAQVCVACRCTKASRPTVSAATKPEEDARAPVGRARASSTTRSASAATHRTAATHATIARRRARARCGPGGS